MAITFISHSSAETEEDQANADSVRAELIKRLPDHGWEVLVDDHLPPGMNWRSVLYGWISDCDVAVVLVNRDGLSSSWLKREVNILLWRQSVGSPLTIVPVLLKGLSPRELRRSEISQLADLQCILQDDPDGVDDTDGTGGTDVVSRIVERLGGLRVCADTSAMRSMTAKIEHCLDGVTDRFTLRAMAGTLGAEGDWRFPTAAEERRHIAHQCLAPVPTQKVPAAVNDVEFFLALDRLNKLITLLLPTWIDPVGVRLLLPGAGQVVATLAGAWSDTARQHIHRASCFSGGYWAQAVSLVAGEAQDEEHMAACLTAVRALLKSDDEDDLPIEGEVLFLVLDPAGTELGVVGRLVRTLIGRFSWLNVIVLTDQADPVDLGVQTARTLHIPLQPGAERQVARTSRALGHIRDRHHGHGKDQAS
ncbi:toll/interleukin-1 receptor domain-containing protein [Streptomyces sp. AS02]|uniref:toll/interleukin-1 receptor domain-containing protein n=1 Tax=Streptomyces sp. AS02 TaxID=2938946 RepID=UPI00201FE0F4|nr:toll/interleukin-1 receptor domain-containing protein [Streptomyces sp. AS02]MCL8013427.1 toll/interleukin-1 receptor domain-containing protein [Streptomyces sp. AS02]